MTLLFRFLLIASLACFATLATAQNSDSDVTTAQDAIEQAASNAPLDNTAVSLYPLWEDVATAAEKALDDPDSTRAELDQFRMQIAQFRAQFSSARSANADRIGTLESQLAALGPVPENGEEAPAVVEKRSELEARLEELRAPSRVADAAFRRAEGLISEIDTVLRERQARRLLSLGPSPLDPRNLPVMAADMQRMVGDLSVETLGLGKRLVSRDARDRLPLVLLLTVVAITLMLKGGTWVRRGIDYLRRFGGRGTGVWSFLFSLLRIVVPLSGLLLLTYAIRLTDTLGPIMENLLTVVPVVGILVFGFRWLAERLFAREAEEALINLPNDKRKSARFYMLLIAVLFSLRFIVDALFNIESAEAETVAILSFPVVIMMGAVLATLGRNLRQKYEAEEETEEGTELEASIGLTRAFRGCGTAMIGVGLAAPAMAALGYAEAGNALLYPMVLSLVILGLVLAFQRFFVDVYALLTNQGAEVRDSLVAVCIWGVLILGCLPLLALMWGARVSDLTELWTQFLEGFEIGETRISPADFLAFAIIFSICYGLTRLIQNTLRSSVLPKTRIDIGGQNAIVSGVGYVGIFLSGLVAVTGAGLDLSGLAIVAGALSVGIGFGLRTIVENFVSGIILLVGRPVSEGDWIEVGGQMGYVRHISVRSTRIETFDRTDVIVPNSDLISGTVTNYTHGNTIGRLIVPVGVAYGTDTKRVETILREIAEAQPMVLSRPAPNVLFMGFGADSLDFEIRAILRDVNWVMDVKSKINHEIARRFTEEEIEIPFAQRDVWLRNPETLQAPTRPSSDHSEESMVEDIAPADPDGAIGEGDADR